MKPAERHRRRALIARRQAAYQAERERREAQREVPATALDDEGLEGGDMFDDVPDALVG